MTLLQILQLLHDFQNELPNGVEANVRVKVDELDFTGVEFKHGVASTVFGDLYIRGLHISVHLNDSSSSSSIVYMTPLSLIDT